MTVTEQTRLTDRDVVVDRLRRTGPRSLSDLRREDALSDWSRTRIERAVAQAWADNRLGLDVEDRLIAL